MPFAPAALDRARFERFSTGESPPSSHFLSPRAVFKTSPSASSSSWFESPSRRATGVASSARRRRKGEELGGEGVDSGTDEGAVVWDVADGMRRDLEGVEGASEPRERSG